MFLHESFRSRSSSIDKHNQHALDSVAEDPASPAVDRILQEVENEEWYTVRFFVAVLFLVKHKYCLST